MRFSSLPFLFGFLPITLTVYFAVPTRWRNLVLLLTSLIFYGWGEPVYIGIMGLSILIDYTHGLLVEKYRSRDALARWFVAESMILNLGLLGFFKYWDFFAANLSLIPGVSIPALGLPPAHRHFLFYLSDHELYHRRLPAGCPGAAEHRVLRGVCHHVPPAGGGAYRPL